MDGTRPDCAEGAAILEAIFQHTTLLVAYLDMDLRFVRVNRAYAEADGRDPAFFVGKRHFDLYPHPENERIFRRVAQTGVPHIARSKPFEYAYAPQRGTTHWDWSLVPVRTDGVITGLVLSLLDVSARVRAMEELRTSEELARTLFEQAPYGIVLVDPASGEIREANAAATELVFAADPPAQARALVEQLACMGTGRHAIEIADAEGQARQVAIETRSVVVQGRTMLLSVLEDVTELTRTHERLRRSVEEKEVLLREVHHRVKNNLQVISSLLYLQRGKVDDPAALRAFDESRNRILAMATIHERLYASGDFTQVDLASYLDGLVKSVAATYSTDQVGIDLVVDAAPLRLAVDVAIPCGLVLNELVSNAIEHAFPHGRGGRVVVTARTVGAHGVLLAVEDDGVGMPDPVRPDLGLRMVESLAKELGAALSIRRGAGTRVTLELDRSAGE